MTARLPLALLLAAALLPACAQAPAPPSATPATAAAPALTPLEAIVGYRLTAEGDAPPIAVMGVAPSVSGDNGAGLRFMVRQAAHEVVRVDARGDLVAWGGLGGQAGRFNHPGGLCVSANRVFVADTLNHRVQAFDVQGRHVGTFGAFGNRPGHFHHPRAVELTAGGLLVVTDDMRIQFLDPADGTVLGVLPHTPPVTGMARTVLQEVVYTTPTDRGNSSAVQGDTDRGASNRDRGASNLDWAAGDLHASLALFQKLAQQMRDGARQDRQAELARGLQVLQAAAAQIRSQGEERFMAAVVQGSIQASVTGLKGSSALARTGAVGALSNPVGGLAGAGTEGMVARGAGGLGGLGSIAIGGSTPPAELERAKLEAEARSRRGEVDEANEVMQQMMDVIRDVRDKLAAIEQSRIETNRGIARNI